MLRIGKIAGIFGFAMLLPVVASAQAIISGVVRDASGAVLPGVTVEATSPALIEKVRTTVTDGTGQYAIENLRPGIYTVTFTLPGFATVEREGVELSGSFNARINADLRVGAVEETITVTGETPVVDVASTRQQRVLDREILDALPNSGLRTGLGVLIPSVDFRRQDVGGAGVRAVTGNMVAHGARSEDAGTTLNGMTIATFGTGAATATIFLNPMGLQEMTVSTGANDAELHAGGVRTNYVLREGGNTFNGVVFGAYAPGKWQADNLTDELRSRGLAAPNKIRANWDINPAFGGPILRDKIWFFGAARYNVNEDYVAGLFWNKNANNPNAWTYEPDTSSPGLERAETAGHAAPRQLAGDAAQQDRRHLLQHQLLLLSDRRLRDAFVGSGPACRVPVSAPVRGRLDRAAHQPAAARSERPGLQLGEQPHSLGRTGGWDDPGAGAEHRHAVSRGRDVPRPGSGRVYAPRRVLLRDRSACDQGRRLQPERQPRPNRIRPVARQLSPAGRRAQSDHAAGARRMEGQRRCRSRACSSRIDGRGAR